MAQPDYKARLEETLTMAFACQDKKTRMVYLQLADFYEEQALMEVRRERGGSLQIFR